MITQSVLIAKSPATKQPGLHVEDGFLPLLMMLCFNSNERKTILTIAFSRSFQRLAHVFCVTSEPRMLLFNVTRENVMKLNVKYVD